MSRGIASLSRWLAALVTAVSVPCILAPTSAAAAGVSVQVAAVTQTVTNAPASQTPATAGCASGTVLVGGGIRVFHAAGDQIVTPTVYEPTNGLVVKGSLPTDASGTSVPNADPASWTAFGGFAGQSEAADDVTAFAMCSAGGPNHTQVVTVTVNGPTAAATVAKVTASCPAGTRLVGGGGQTLPASSASLKTIGSYPSDTSGSTATATDPDSWTAVGESGGAANVSNTTTAFAVCSTDATLHTQVVRADVIDHPAGAGNANPGQDPVATATATCPFGSTLLDGGALADGNAPGPDGGPPQQGVHMRGSYPSTAAAAAVADGTPAPTSWSSIVQSGGQATPGTDTHAFALCSRAPAGGAILATGYNGYGQFCNGTTTSGSTAAGAVSPLDAGVMAVAAGAVHSMALKSDGTVSTCGRNNFGQLGNGTTTDSSTPVAVTLPGTALATAIAADEYHSLALTSSGAVYAWGHNAFGQLGNGTTTDSSTPVAVAVPGTVTQIAAGWSFNLALTSTGAVYAWGYNGDGELGTTSADTCATFYACAKTPVAVSLGGATVKAIAAGWNHSLAIRSDGTVLAWGLNNYGQLGLGDTTNRSVPTPSIGGAAAKAVACGGAHSLAIRSDSAGIAWGLNSRGQLGDGTTTNRSSPVSPPALSNLTAIAAGAFHSLAIQLGGAPLAWGYNANGQLGDGTTTNRLSPVTPLAPASANVTGIAGGWAHTLFVK
jgi:alpha-tubulin suppressor-like RCC1 family protein